MSSRVPPLLEPYLSIPSQSSLTLLTSVLGANANWLVLRYLYSYLRAAGSTAATTQEGHDGVGVVLLSFMRDAAFWRDGAAKLGLDLDVCQKAGRFVFVDGLTGLFSPEAEHARPSGSGSDRVIKSSRLDDVSREVELALADLKTGTRVLLIDQIDLLLAAAPDDGSSSGVGVNSPSLQSMLLSLREKSHSTVLTLSADAPLVHAQATALEREHAALLLGQAHAADVVLALRMLDTGTAKDVSGVLRITAGGGHSAGGEGDGGVEERELLYHVGGDGNVRVFERGT